MDYVLYSIIIYVQYATSQAVEIFDTKCSLSLNATASLN